MPVSACCAGRVRGGKSSSSILQQKNLPKSYHYKNVSKHLKQYLGTLRFWLWVHGQTTQKNSYMSPNGSQQLLAVFSYEAAEQGTASGKYSVSTPKGSHTFYVWKMIKSRHFTYKKNANIMKRKTEQQFMKTADRNHRERSRKQ